MVSVSRFGRLKCASRLCVAAHSQIRQRYALAKAKKEAALEAKHGPNWREIEEQEKQAAKEAKLAEQRAKRAEVRAAKAKLKVRTTSFHSAARLWSPRRARDALGLGDHVFLSVSNTYCFEPMRSPLPNYRRA